MESLQIQQKIATEQKSLQPQGSWIDNLFKSAIKNRSRVIFTFKIYYYLLLAFTLVGGYSAYFLTDNFLFFYNLAVWSGKIGLLFYILTVIPGIARRFTLKHKLISLLMIFRRYTGIAMFLGVLAHFIVIRGAGYLREGVINLHMPLFELLGLTAFILVAFLFLTSNDYSVFHLKKLWNKIHQLTYIIIWLIAFHVLLQRVSVWSVLISVAVILQIASYIYSRFVKKSPQPIATSTK